MKKVLSMLLMIIFTFPSIIFAFTPNSPVYNSTRDEYVITYSVSEVGKLITKYEHPQNGLIVREFVGSQITGTMYIPCNGTYTYDYHDLNHNFMKRQTFTTTLIKNPSSSCGQVVQPPDDPVDPPDEPVDPPDDPIVPPGEPVDPPDDPVDPPDDGGSTPTNPDISLEECATIICQCIADLRSVSEQIEENTGGILSEIGNVVAEQIETNNQLSDMNQTLDEINMTTSDILGQLVTPNNYSVPSSSMYQKTIEENKPPMPSTSFQDNRIYFQDQGDANVNLTPLPSAPEPTDNWGGIFRETEGQVDPVGQAEPVLKSDAIIQQEPVLNSDPVLQAEPVLQVDPVLQSDPVKEVDPVLQADPVKKADNPFVADPIDTTLPRWKP